jgi:hypothetical protein
MQIFIAKCGLEVAECELVGDGLPVTQDGANRFASKVWANAKKAGPSANFRRRYAAKHSRKYGA